MRADLRRKTSALGAIALLGALTGGLTACSPADPAPVPSQSSTATVPAFETDAEALAAATEAYARYQSVADRIFAEGGVEPDRLRDVAAERLADSAVADYLDLQTRGVHSSGNNTFDSVQLQSINEGASNGDDVVVVYLCEDVSQSDVLNAAGESVVTDERPERTALQVGFDWKDDETDQLVVGSETVWAGGDIC